ncbi:MAG TPA: MFS transporter [Candidatus Cryptobacteroides excrementigallinarum]|nr:MFS transporter [Candidatus Cryptobacteroides excrementigallinarum]
MKGQKLSRNPWSWVPSLYFAEGIPYFIVNVLSVTMFKRLGMSNGDLAMYTSLLYLPWVIKPLWSPFVDIIRTKRWWILSMQALMTVGFAALALSVSPDVFGFTLVFFYIVAFASATHDIAADGYYMIALNQKDQSLFVGIRSTFYRIASVFGQGVIVVVAGQLEESTGRIPLAWSLVLLGSSVLFAALSLWHWFVLPKAEKDSGEGGGGTAARKTAGDIFHEFGNAWLTFFRKPGIWLAVLFMLLYRLPEAFSVKMLTPFMLDPVEEGGLGLTTTQSGLVYGTVGVIALTVGGILGGIFSARHGLRRSLWPMSLSLALPCAVYLIMALMQPEQLWFIYFCVAFDQFGYGFGFTAYMLYMMHFSEGEFKTSHYAICTAFMALSMMVPGVFAGWLQEALGYVGFFIMVMICCLATVFVTWFARRRC